MTKTINYESTPEFQKDFKKLGKRFRSLKNDFEIMKRFTLETYYLKGAPTTAIIPIEGFCNEKYQSIKVKKFACVSLKKSGNRSGIRVIYVYENVEGHKITFIEIYYKGDSEKHDETRLKNFIKILD